MSRRAACFSRAEWPVGERVSRWHGEELEVVNFVETNEEAGFQGYVVVKQPQ